MYDGHNSSFSVYVMFLNGSIVLELLIDYY